MFYERHERANIVDTTWWMKYTFSKQTNQRTWNERTNERTKTLKKKTRRFVWWERDKKKEKNITHNNGLRFYTRFYEKMLCFGEKVFQILENGMRSSIMFVAFDCGLSCLQLHTAIYRFDFGYTTNVPSICNGIIFIVCEPKL